MCAEPHRKIGERSLEILESAIDREDLLVDCAPLRDGGGIEGADGRPSTCVEINRCGSGARRAELHATPSSVGGVAVEKVFRTDACASVQRASGHAVGRRVAQTAERVVRMHREASSWRARVGAGSGRG